MSNKYNYESNNINCLDIEISNKIMSCRVFWARIISSESENLLTQNTKHTFYEIQYALEGRIGMSLGEDGQRIIFDESDFIIIPPNTYHQIVDGDTEGARFIMAFSFDATDNALGAVKDNLLTALPHRETSRMRRILSLLNDTGASDNLIGRRRTCALLEAFLLEIFEALDPCDHTKFHHIDMKKKGGSGTLSNILEYVHSMGGIGISVDSLSKRFNLSARHLNRLFNSELGESPKEVINREKLSRIEALVSTTLLSLGEVAELCGFSDEYAMNKFFRRYTLSNLSSFRAISKKR